MESHPQNPEVRGNPENIHPCILAENNIPPLILEGVQNETLYLI